MKFRKKPVVVEAEQFFMNKVPWPQGVIYHHNTQQLQFQEHCFSCKTLEGTLNVSDGDWIIKGVNGEFYPCKPDIFEKTYERVEE